jgi:hypothetical protein
MLFPSVPSSFAAPVELLQNGSFKNGLEGWTKEGMAFVDGEDVRIVREGSLSQIVRRPDLSFHLELAYNLRTELPSQAYFARSLVTFYLVGRNGKSNNFTIVGERHSELGDSGWKETRLSLLQLFKREIGDQADFQLLALRVTIELGFTISAHPPGVASLRNVSLRRVNPARILLQSALVELPDRTELIVTATNVGDMNASNIIATMIPPPETIVISRNVVFLRSTLEGGASWQLSWVLAAKSSGVRPITIKVSCDQTGTELSLGVPLPGIPYVTTPQATTVTVERVTDQVNEAVLVFLLTALLVLLAFLILTIVLPIAQSRKGTDSVYRFGPLRS